MKTFGREGADAEWDNFWNTLKEEWFKVEVLQDYSGEDMGSSLKAWLDGDKEESIKILRSEAEDSESMRADSNPQFKKIRIHIVEEPYSQYLLWEIECYKTINVPLLTEEIYLVNKDEVAEFNLPDGDFVIFDDKKVIRNHYSPDGRMHKADFYYENDDISKFIHIKKNLLKIIENNPHSKLKI